MDAKAYLSAHGREHCEQIAVKAGTTLAYFLQIVYGNRFPSRKLAAELESASGGEMTREELLYGTPRDDTTDKQPAAA